MGVPKTMDLARAPVKSGPCSFTQIIIVERNIAGNTEKIPLSVSLMFERSTAILIIIPANIPRKRIFFGV